MCFIKKLPPFLLCRRRRKWNVVLSSVSLLLNWNSPVYRIVQNPIAFFGIQKSFLCLRQLISNRQGGNEIYLLTGINLLPKWWGTFWSYRHMHGIRFPSLEITSTKWIKPKLQNSWLKICFQFCRKQALFQTVCRRTSLEELAVD